MILTPPPRPAINRPEVFVPTKPGINNPLSRDYLGLKNKSTCLIQNQIGTITPTSVIPITTSIGTVAISR